MTDPVPNRTTTPRGFTGYDEFTDSRGSRIRVQLSSAAMVLSDDDGVNGPFVWIFCQDADKKDDSPHLTVPQARRLKNALAAFIRENK